MLCVACGANVNTTPCPRCGRSPLLRGRYQLTSPIDRHGHLYCTEDSVGRRKTGTVLILPRSRDGLDAVVAALGDRIGALRAHAPPSVQLPAAPYAHDIAGHTAVILPAGPLLGGHAGERFTRRPAGLHNQLALLEGGLQALAAMHALDPPMIHGLVGPESIFLDEAGQVVLIGAGLRERGLDPGWSVPRVPEAEPVPASDLYQLALTVLAASVGQPASSLVDDAGRIHWADDGGMHPLLKGLLERMTRVDPQERPADATEALSMFTRAKQALGSHPDAPTMLREALTGPVHVSLDDAEEALIEADRRADAASLTVPDEPTHEHPVIPRSQLQTRVLTGALVVVLLLILASFLAEP